MNETSSKSLRVAVVTKSGLHAGGAHTYEAAVVSVLRQLEQQGGLDVTVLTPREVPRLEGGVGASAEHTYSHSTGSKLRSLFASTALGGVVSRLVPLSPLERDLQRIGIDLVYFPSPNIHAIGFRKLPFLFTVWDLGHSQLRHFPEFSSRGEGWIRERLFRWAIPRSWCTLTDSVWTGKSLEAGYGIPREHWESLGMAFTVRAREEVGSPSTAKPYFVYPAQKWPHKNHLTLLRAFRSVVDIRPDVTLVLMGSAKSQDVPLTRWVKELELEENVTDLGFVDDREAQALIAGATALVMPTFLGPTNLPPLEAASYGVRSIVSDVHHFDEDLSGYLTTVGADDVEQWAKEMLHVLNLAPLSPWVPEMRASEVLRGILQRFKANHLA